MFKNHHAYFYDNTSWGSVRAAQMGILILIPLKTHKHIFQLRMWDSDILKVNKTSLRPANQQSATSITAKRCQVKWGLLKWTTTSSNYELLAIKAGQVVNKAIFLSFDAAAPRLLDSWSLGQSLSLASLEKSKCKTSLPHISSQEALFMPRLPVCFWWLPSTCLWRCPFLSVLSPLTHTSSFRWIIRWLEAVLLKGTDGGRKYRETHMQQKKGYICECTVDGSLSPIGCMFGGRLPGSRAERFT